jgi:hypothetical protein
MPEAMIHEEKEATYSVSHVELQTTSVPNVQLNNKQLATQRQETPRDYVPSVSSGDITTEIARKKIKGETN